MVVDLDLAEAPGWLLKQCGIRGRWDQHSNMSYSNMSSIVVVVVVDLDLVLRVDFLLDLLFSR